MTRPRVGHRDEIVTPPLPARGSSGKQAVAPHVLSSHGRVSDTVS